MDSRGAGTLAKKYAVRTSKQVSGYCLWDSKVQWKGKKFDLFFQDA